MDTGYSVAGPAAACFLAIVFLYSQYNSRGTEDMTHPLWNIILYRLCERHIIKGRLMPTPQYRIWVTKSEFDYEPEEHSEEANEPEEAKETEENSDNEKASTMGNFLDGLDDENNVEEEEFDEFDISCATAAQGSKGIMEVIADYVVLVPQVRLQLKTGIAWLDNNPNLANIKKKMLGLLDDPAAFLEALTFVFPTWTAARAFKVYMPLLLELKRPISRNPTSVEQHVKQIHDRLLDAMLQVEQQALCLFKSGKFADQDWAFLIAATGDFWTFRVIRRGETEGEVKMEFSKKNYAKHWGHKYKYAADEVEDESKFTERIPVENRLAAEETPSGTEKKPQIFTVEEINVCVRGLGLHGSDIDKRKTFNGSREWVACKPIDFSKDIIGCFDWSPVLKIGTEASHGALSYISGQLDEFVSQNGVIIT